MSPNKYLTTMKIIPKPCKSNYKKRGERDMSSFYNQTSQKHLMENYWTNIYRKFAWGQQQKKSKPSQKKWRSVLRRRVSKFIMFSLFFSFIILFLRRKFSPITSIVICMISIQIKAVIKESPIESFRTHLNTLSNVHKLQGGKKHHELDFGSTLSDFYSLAVEFSSFIAASKLTSLTTSSTS